MNTIQSYEDKVLLLATAYVFCMNVIESYEDRVLLAAVGVLCMKTPFSCIKTTYCFLLQHLCIMVVAVSSLAIILGECLTSHSPPALFFFFFFRLRLARSH